MLRAVGGVLGDEQDRGIETQPEGLGYSFDGAIDQVELDLLALEEKRHGNCGKGGNTGHGNSSAPERRGR